MKMHRETHRLLGEVRKMAERMEAAEHALHDIYMLNPETDSPEGMNEWGEAECFNKAKVIAEKALFPKG